MVLAAKVARGEFIAIAGDRIPVSLNARVAPALLSMMKSRRCCDRPPRLVVRRRGRLT